MIGLSKSQAAAIGRGLGDQLDRANGLVTVQQLKADQEQEIARMQARIDILKDRIAVLEAQLAAGGDGQNRDGRQICTPAAAARRLGVSQSTISRYISEGWIESYTIGGGKKPRYMVYVDSLRRKPRRKQS